MARKEATLSMCMFTQELNPDYFQGWTEEELAAIKNADIAAIVSVIGNRLTAAGYAPAELHGIIHDSDSKEIWDNVTCTTVTVMKTTHFHIVCKFAKVENKLLSGTLPQIAAAVGLADEFVEKAKKGKNAYDNMLAYLIHIKYADKFLYKPEQVYSAGCECDGVPMFRSYMSIYAERKQEWEEGRAKIKASQARIDIDLLEEKILLGEVTKNQVLLTDKYFEIYARNKRRCEDAFDTYSQHKIAKTIRAMENGEFRVSVFFITGKSHSGKSFFTDSLVKSLQAFSMEAFGEMWSVCSCAATNPFDEYSGEEILVMDDLRGMALTASDWLKLLDPDRINTGSARYKNKKIACRTIIINSEKDVLDFFYYLKGAGGDRSEAMDQFFRRILAKVVVYRIPDTDERRFLIGNMSETAAYQLEAPTGSGNLTLHHTFQHNEETKAMNSDEAIAYLIDIVARNNGTERTDRNDKC